MSALSAAGRPAVFLDRDGVVVKVLNSEGKERPPRSMEELDVAEDAAVALGRLREAGFSTIVVTNQPDIARGSVSHGVVRLMHDRLRSQLPIDAVYYCPHDNDDECECRKPKAGLILQAAAERELDLTKSCLIGDRWVDLGAAGAAGIDGVLLETPHSWWPTSQGGPSWVPQPIFTGQSLAGCVDFILSSGRYA